LPPTSLAVVAAGASGPLRQASARWLYDAPVSEPHVRKVRPEEMEEVWRVHVAASNDLMVRRGRPAARADAPVASDARAGLASDPGGGFRIGDPTLFMASRLFGRHELYLPSGPILY
jgi:hypothetical protein